MKCDLNTVPRARRHLMQSFPSGGPAALRFGRLKFQREGFTPPARIFFLT